jgi:hypothetical protein
MLTAPEELRDEMFCQVVKQTRGKPNAEFTEKAWRLMLFYLSTFSPSQSLMLPLMAHCVATMADHPSPVVVKVCIGYYRYCI